EYGNEVWNWGMPVDRQYIHALANTAPTSYAYDGNIVNGKIVPDTLNADGTPHLVTDQNTRDARCCAERARQVALIFRAAFADRPNDLKTIWAGQAGWNAWAKSGLDWIAAKYGDHPFDELAIAAYVTCGGYLPIAATQHTTTQTDALTDVFNATSKFISTDLSGQLDQHAALCKQYGLDLVMYEGGQSLMPVNKTAFASTDLLYQVQLDPRMGQQYDQLFAMCHSKGVTLFMNYSMEGAWSKFGFWGSAQTLTDTAGPRWQCLLRESAKSN